MSSSQITPLEEKVEPRTVSPCCCCPMTYRQFYSFINISDIIGCIIGLIITAILIILAISVSILGIIITVTWLIVAIVGLCIFKSTKSFREGFHKFYSILRGVICILDIIFMCILLGYVCFGEIHDVLRPFRILLIVLVLLLIVMCIFNLYWSVLFFEVIFSDSKGSPASSEINEDDNTVDQPNSEKSQIDSLGSYGQSPQVN